MSLTRTHALGLVTASRLTRGLLRITSRRIGAAAAVLVLLPLELSAVLLLALAALLVRALGEALPRARGTAGYLVRFERRPDPARPPDSR